MKKFFGLFLLFLVLGLLMASSVLAVNPIDSLGDTLSGLISKIGSLSFLGDSGTQLIGFLRILYGILVFTLMYLAFHAIGDKVPKNIAIAISVILAIIVAIFTPGTVLVAFAGSYSVAAATILFGGLFGAAIWFVIGTKTETAFALGVKVGLLLLATWLVAQFDTLMINSKLVTFGPGTTMFVNAVNFISDWAYLVFFLLLVWVIVAFLLSRRGEGGTGSGVSDAASGLKEKIKEKMEKKKTGKKAEEAEEAEMLEFVDLKRLQKDVNNAKTPADLDKLQSDERTAERHESRANRRINQVKKQIKDADLSAAEKQEAEEILNEIDIYNKELLKDLNTFNNQLKNSRLAFGDKRRRLSEILDELIETDRALVAGFEKLKKLLK
ncbi:MAG: hypothetical protein AABW48_04445 [Nanoarchaeota archaeon]